MPLPAHYDTFDPEAHDRERERLEALTHKNFDEDLSNLTSEADELYRAAWERSDGRSGASDMSALERAFEEANPRPQAPEAYALWAWEKKAHSLDRQGYGRLLCQHIIGKRVFVERAFAYAWDRHVQGREADRLAATQPSAPSEPEPPSRWPDPERPDLPLTLEDFREGRSSDFEGDVDEASFIATRSLRWFTDAEVLGEAALTWLYSVPEGAVASCMTVYLALDEASRYLRWTYTDEHAPATIGRTLMRTADAIAALREALSLLEGARHPPNLTAEARARFTALVEASLESASEQYAALQAIYDGYLERVRTVLHAEKWDAPPPLVPEAPGASG